MTPKIRVAIVGGGIAGLTLANGLIRHECIEFHVFEGKSTFRERGASVGLAPNAQNALQEMGLDIDEAFKSAGAGARKATKALVAIGEHKGKVLFEVPPGIYSVARVRWQEQLLKNIPEEKLHVNKKLKSIDGPLNQDRGYQLYFEDGIVFESDVVVGCDGLHSKVREVIVGATAANQEAIAPIFAGYWDARGCLTAERALEVFGTELYDPRSPAEICLIGDGSFILLIRSGEGDTCHFAVSARAGPGYDTTAWKTPLSRELLDETYKDWDENIKAGIIEGLLDPDSGPGVVFSQWESPKAPSYVRRRLCMIGDSAHTTTPWMGQGAAMSTEDAAVLSALLGKVQSRQDLEPALMIFDQTRRGRPEKVIQQSREAAKLMTGQCGLDPLGVESLQCSKWWTDLWAFDMKAHIKTATERLDNLIRERLRAEN